MMRGRLSFRVQADVSASKGFVGIGLTWTSNERVIGVGLTVVCVTLSAVWLRERPVYDLDKLYEMLAKSYANEDMER